MVCISDGVVIESQIYIVPVIIGGMRSGFPREYFGADYIIRAVGRYEPDHITERPISNRFELSDNYPNPFNPVTRIDYNLPEKVHAKLVVYNVLGQVVTTLVDEDQEPGDYAVIWDGTDANGRKVASGIYFYTLTAGQHTATKKMLLVK